MIQKADNHTGFTQQLNMTANQEAADKLIRNRQRTDHPRHRHDNRTDDRSTGTTEKRRDLTKTQDQRTEIDDTKNRQMNFLL